MSNRTLVNQKSLSSWLVKQPKENQNSGMLIINSTITKDRNDHITLKCRYLHTIIDILQIRKNNIEIVI